jgi:hypothetical protein
MSKTLIELNNESEELVFHIKKKYDLKKPEALNLCFEILTSIYKDNKEKVYKLAEQIKTK